ncbi:Nse4 C-terminal-domain-containing protein [Gorgonomyces haynaldii]|nr:Nse4 C-terminal-domain-containing protein [Gorgonomyces haynaldii]
MNSQTLDEKRLLRMEYRSIIQETEAEQQNLVLGDAQWIMSKLDQAERLFGSVETVQEATLDSQLLLLSAEISNKKIQKMGMGGFSFEEYIDRLKQLSRSDTGLDWTLLAEKTQKHCRMAPKPSFMYGPLEIQLKERTVRQQRRLVKDMSKLQKPEEMTVQDVKKDENETSNNVMMIHKRLTQVEPISIFKFVVNPHSFSQTVENVFYLSFLVRDGRVAIEESDEGELIVSTSEPPTEEDMQESDCSKLQNILILDYETWNDMIQAFDIKESIIPNRQPVADAQATKWHG